MDLICKEIEVDLPGCTGFVWSLPPLEEEYVAVVETRDGPRVVEAERVYWENRAKQYFKRVVGEYYDRHQSD